MNDQRHEPRQFEVLQADFEDYNGICLTCGEIRFSGVEPDGRLCRLRLYGLRFGCLRRCDVGLGSAVGIGRVTGVGAAGIYLPEVGRFFGRNIGIGRRLPLQGAFEPRALAVGHADAAAQFFGGRPLLLLHTLLVGLRGYRRVRTARGSAGLTRPSRRR